MQTEGILHSIETCGAVDGPGLRYIAFFQGCLMRCLYCHNRDSWPLQSDTSQIVTVAELMKEVMSYRFYLKASGGGVTASGGEPLLQYEFIGQWFAQCRAAGLNTCLDTNGYARFYDEKLDYLLDHTDLVMLDLKQIDPQRHKALVGVHVDKTLKFAQYLAERKQSVRVRLVVVPGYTDDDATAHLLGEFIAPMENVLEVELLPYHELGAHKWALFGDTYKLQGVLPPPAETLQRVQGILAQYGKKAFF